MSSQVCILFLVPELLLADRTFVNISRARIGLCTRGGAIGGVEAACAHRRNGPVLPSRKLDRVSRHKYVVGCPNALNTIQTVAARLASSAFHCVDQDVTRTGSPERIWFDCAY